MSYRMLEELQNRRKEKVAIFLTFENIVGLILVFFPVFLSSSGGLPLLLRAPLCLAAAVLGVALTLDVHGLAIYERALWQLRGIVRLRTRGRVITPDDLAGAVAPETAERPLPLDGPIQVVERARPLRLGPIAPLHHHGGAHADPAAE
jgi:hypothetical protein